MYKQAHLETGVLSASIGMQHSLGYDGTATNSHGQQLDTAVSTVLLLNHPPTFISFLVAMC